MDYELAKELKEAGYPQKVAGMSSYCKHWLGRSICTNCKSIGLGFDDDFIVFPTLSELIEALGEEFYSLKRYEDSWLVGGKELNAKGKTPEEVVAKLWLSLNKK